MRVVVHQTPLADLQRLQQLVSAESLRLERPLLAVEVGSYTGESALAIHDGMLHGGKLWCVDDFSGGSETDPLRGVMDKLRWEVMSAFRENLSGLLGNKIFHLQLPSLEAAQLLETKPPKDVIFLDADHTYESVAADIQAWWPQLRPGGLMCGHDYGEASFFPGVDLAVNEFAEQHGLLVNYRRYSAVWAIRKEYQSGASNGQDQQ
jgi:cephalosporin hydroxylase